MGGRARRWGAVAFALVVALAGGIVVFVQHLLSEPASPADARSTALETADPNGAASAAARGETPPHPDATATPTVTAVEPRLEWPDEESLRRLEQGGRALFGGIVRAPDGSPCEGATVWFDGEVVATTDDRGAWRADVSSAKFDVFTGIDSWPTFGHLLVARKEHVGYATDTVAPPSRRIDLTLSGGHAFSGTVIDFDDGTPVGDAELELRWSDREQRSVVLATRADALGRFEFPSLPAGDVFVRGHAPGYDSNGFFGYDFSRGRDMVVAYRLRRQFRMRGRFVPWPAPGIPPERATVRAMPKSPHDRNAKFDCRGPIGADGRFELPLPVCPSCILELDVGEAPFWSEEFDTNEERRDFDVGDVGLPAAAILTGRFDVPDSDLRERIDVRVSVSTALGRGISSHAHLESDGSFRVAPLPPGWTTVSLSLGRSTIATLEEADGLSEGEHTSAAVELVAGTTRDVGTISTTATILHGTVRDADGMPVAWVCIDENVKVKAGWYAGVFSVQADGDGHFIGVRNLDGFDEDEALALAGHAEWEVLGGRHLTRHVTVDWPASQHWVRHDVSLEGGLTLRGTLLDAAGAPVPRTNVAIDIEVGSVARVGSDVTRSDGTFEICGLVEGTYRVFVAVEGGAVQYLDVRAENGPVTLRPFAASKQ